MATILGIDPGVHGAVAALKGDGTLIDVIDLPVSVNGALSWVNGVKLRELILSQDYGHGISIAVERAQPNPKNGGIAMFKSGLILGSILSIAQVTGARIELIPPQSWKAGMGLLMKRGVKMTDTERKRQSLDRARQLFPSADLPLAMHHNRAEALLLAHWYFRNRYGMGDQSDMLSRGDGDDAR